MPSADAQAVRAVVERRRQVGERPTAEQLRLKQARVAVVQERIRRHLAGLTTELDERDEGDEGATDLRQRVEARPVWRAQEAHLTRVPGVGQTTACVLVAELPALGRLPRKQIAAWVGVGRRGSAWVGVGRRGSASPRSPRTVGPAGTATAEAGADAREGAPPCTGRRTGRPWPPPAGLR